MSDEPGATAGPRDVPVDPEAPGPDGALPATEPALPATEPVVPGVEPVVPGGEPVVPATEPVVPAAGAPVAPPRRSRGRQTALDMVLSMAAILAMVAVVLLLAPAPGAVDQPQVDDATAAAALQQAADGLGADPLLLRVGPAGVGPSTEQVPSAAAVVQVGEGWRLDYARTEQTDDVTTWRQGVLSPDERRVDVEQAVDPTPEWLTRTDAGEPSPPEPVEVGGLSWSRQVRGDGDTAYTYVPSDGGGPRLTTAVTATSDSADLQGVVALLSEALGGRPAEG